MKLVKLFTIAAVLTAFASTSFAGSCCSKKKECAPGDKPKAEAPKPEAPKQ